MVMASRFFRMCLGYLHARRNGCSRLAAWRFALQSFDEGR
jgi:hypothetical protein